MEQPQYASVQSDQDLEQHFVPPDQQRGSFGSEKDFFVEATDLQLPTKQCSWQVATRSKELEVVCEIPEAGSATEV